MDKKIFGLIVILFIVVAIIIGLSIDKNVTIENEFAFIKKEINNDIISIEYNKASSFNTYYIEISTSDNIVYKKTTSKTKLDLNLENLINGTEYILTVYADLGDGKREKIKDDYHFVWNNPKFIYETVILDNKDYTLNIDASTEDGSYSIAIFEGEEQLIKETIDSNEFIISKDLFEKKEKILTVMLFKGEIKLDELKLYNNINPLTDIEITSIENKEVFNLSNILLKIEGGDNADHYNIKLYKDKSLIKEINTREKVSLLSKKMFDLKKNYRLVITAICGNYTKTAEVNFSIDEYEQTEPVYLSNDWTNLKKGTKLELLCNDSNAKIMYTTDGTNPLTNGKIYTEPLTVNNDFTLTTVAIPKDKKKANSIIKTFDVKISERKELAVYISPSNQYRNIGISDTGYTNEMDEMNDLSQYIIERLEENGVKVYRNNPTEKIKDWVKESNAYKVNLHLAVHSNASNNHDEYGIETWIHTDSSNTLSLANAIQKGLVKLYPYKDRKDYDRGIRYAAGALGEVNEENLDFGILVEIAHHDDKQDAEWIMQKKKEIGYTIADNILRYYQVIE